MVKSLFCMLSCAIFLLAPALVVLAADAKDDPFPQKVDAGGVTLYTSGEGTLTRREVDGRVGWTATGKSCLLYGDVHAVKSSHIKLEFELHDGGCAKEIFVPYDSADDSVLAEARFPGAWKGSVLKLEREECLDYGEPGMARRSPGASLQRTRLSPAPAQHAGGRHRCRARVRAAAGAGAGAPGAHGALAGEDHRRRGEWRHHPAARVLRAARQRAHRDECRRCHRAQHVHRQIARQRRRSGRETLHPFRGTGAVSLYRGHAGYLPALGAGVFSGEGVLES